MNILIVHNYYQIPGGEDTVVDNESRLLLQHGHNVYFYKKNNNEINDYSTLKKIFFPINVVFSFQSYKDVLGIIDGKKIDVIHVHNTVCVISPSVYYAAFKRNIPVVQTIHNFRLICPGASLLRDGKICDECVNKGLLNATKYKCYRNSRLNTFAVGFMEIVHKYIGTYKKLNYICLTEFNKQQLLRINRRGIYIEPERVFVKPNFIASSPSGIPYCKRKQQFVYVGRLDSTKGVKELFEAWAQITEYELIVCGIGPEENWCRKFISDNSLLNVRMMGFVENDKAIDIIRESLALVLPTQWYEGFPMVLVEAFACGTPVLGSDIGNVNDIIQEGINGLHFKHDDPKDIVRAVRKVYDMVESAKKCSDELYSPEENYKMLMDIYMEIT